MSPSAPSPNLAHLLAALASGRALLAGLDDELYRVSHPPFAEASIGAHVRHCLDHVDALLDGLAARRVDYDERGRDERVERERASALARIDATRARIEALAGAPDPGPLAVRQDGGGEERAFAPSTLERELALLASHAIHHFALIAFLLRLAGRDVPEGFGVARSTLAWWRSRRTADAGRTR